MAERTEDEILAGAPTVKMTVTEARELQTSSDELYTALDEAQADVFAGDAAVGYVIIKIVPDPEG